MTVDPQLLHAATASADSASSEQHVRCNLCGNDDYSVVFKADEAQVSQIVKCNQCGLMYANPRRRPVDVDSIRTWDPGFKLVERDRFRLARQRLVVRDYRSTCKHLRSMFPNRGRLIEVGSGIGALSNSFKEDGWQVEAIDPWVEGCQYAESHYGLKAHPMTLEEVRFPDASIDVAVMIHVIEHLPDPAATLAEIDRVLKPGGLLVMETPRYDTLMFKLLGRRERSVSCDGHIYFYTNKSLQQLGQKAGFQVQRAMCVGRSLSLDRLAWNIGVISKSASIQRLIGSVAAKLQFRKLWVHLNVRDMQRVYFQKPERPG
jgi:ubiquinone/menaquinone biosynthesis C-methylase UbiE/ribosomal protein S27E